MKKITIFFTILTILTTGCETTNIIKNDDTSDTNGVCDYGYNEFFEICTPPVLSTDNFTDISIDYTNTHNSGMSNRIISNVYYNYFTSTLEFDFLFTTDENVSRVYVDVYDQLYNREASIGSNNNWELKQQADNSYIITGHIELKEFMNDRTYTIDLLYDYQQADHIGAKRSVTRFIFDTSIYENINLPILENFLWSHRYPESMEFGLDILMKNTVFNYLEVRLNDSKTGEYVSISQRINIEEYTSGDKLIIPSLVISGLDPETSYDIVILASGNNNNDTFEDIIIFSGPPLNNH